MFLIKMKYFVVSLFLLSAFAKAQEKVSLFPLNAVSIESGVFKEAALTDFNYIQALDADRLLAPFLREAGLEPKADSYTNWENTGLDGHTAGHYISALSMYYASTGDKKAKEIALCRETSHIDFEESGSELVALLMESEAIKHYYRSYFSISLKPL